MKVEFFTFNDLHFREHPLAEYGYYATHAVLDLPDGHQVSVITGKHAYQAIRQHTSVERNVR